MSMMEKWEWMLLIGGGFLLAVLTAPYLGVMPLPVSYFVYIVTVVAFWESEHFLRILKRRTPKLIATNFHTTTTGTWYPAGNYAVFTMGDIDYWFTRKGDEGAVVVPRETINNLGKQVALTVNPTPTRLKELPPKAIEKIKQHQIEPPYYFGVASESKELNEIEIQSLEKEIKEQNSQINMLSDVSKGKFETLGDMIEFMKQTQQEMEGEGSWLQKYIGGEDKKKK